MRHTHMTVRVKQQIGIRRLAHVRRAFAIKEVGTVRSSTSPDGDRRATHEQITKGLGGPCKMEHIVRLKMGEYLLENIW